MGEGEGGLPWLNQTDVAYLETRGALTHTLIDGLHLFSLSLFFLIRMTGTVEAGGKNLQQH